MAAVQPRIWDTNYFRAAASILSADSAVASLPIRFSTDPLRTKVWRSDGPWVVMAGWNDKLDIKVDVGPTTFVATLTAGVYTSASAFAAMVRAAIEAADTTGHTWPITYAAFRFTITPVAVVVWHALTVTGANVATAGWKDLGITAADPAGTSISSGADVSQSRHFLAVDLGSSLALTCAQALRHNLSATGTITLKTSNTSVLDALTAGNSDALTLIDRVGPATATAYAYITRTARYAVLLIEDQPNTAGFSEIGVPFVGTFVQPTVGYSNQYVELGDDLSEEAIATDGAEFSDQRAETRAWELKWADISTASGDAAKFRSFRTSTPKFKKFFFDFDAGLAVVTTMVYGRRVTPLPLPVTSGDYWSPSFTFAESIG